MTNVTSISLFIPELTLSLTAIVLLFFAFLKRRTDISSYVAAIGLALSFIFVLKQWNIGNTPLFLNLLILDKPAAFFKAVFIATALTIIIFSRRSNELKKDRPEYYALIIGSVLGMSLLAEANNLLMIYLSLEFVSLMSYLLVGYVRDSIRSSEAALKYVLYGAVASGVFLYGASIYFGMTGTLDISHLAPGTSHLINLESGTWHLASFFILAGFLYKIAAVPMHAWCPDAYEGAPIPITAFLSVAPKAAGFAVLMRVAQELGAQFDWPIVIAIVSAVTMTFGNLAAIPQTNLKRLLAYSSIAHAGYILMGVACYTPKGNEAVYFYFLAYLLMNLGAFLVVQIIANQFGSETLETFKGLGRRGTYGAILSIAMTIFLLSLTGIPPFVGFIGKFYLFSAVIERGLYWLAIVGIINSVISLYYYMRIVKAMLFDTSTSQKAIPVASKQLAAALIILAFSTTILGLAWQWIAVIVANTIS